MARFERLDVLNQIIHTGLVPVFYNPDFEIARQVLESCAAGGARVIEFTNRGDNAYRTFSDLVQHFSKADPDIILGVGSVVDPETAALYISSGANFIVGPILNAEVAKLCNRRKVAYLPGCGSASEISEAEELGAEIVKVFPGDSVGGAKFVKSILGPMPWTRIMPTGGVESTQESIATWFSAGVAAVGIGSSLIREDLIKLGDYDSITKKTSQLLVWIRQARGESLFRGVEHVGLYPTSSTTGKSIADWYQRVFDFNIKEGRSSILLQGSGPGWVEVMKQTAEERLHLAVEVTDFEAAVRALQAKGFEIEEPTLKPDMKSAYLKEPDPAGNRVHLVWRRAGQQDQGDGKE